MKKNVNYIFWIERIFLFVIFLFPLLIKTNYYPPIFEIPKVVFLWIVIPLVSLFLIVNTVIHKPIIKLNYSVLLTLVIFLSFAVTSSIINSFTMKTIIGNPYRLDGLLTFAICLLFSISISLLPSIYHTSTIPKFISISSLVPFFLILISFLKTPVLDEWQIGYSSYFGNPNFLGGFVLVTLPFTLFLYKHKKNRKYLIITLTSFLTIILSRSIIPIILSSLVFLFFIIRSKIKNYYKIAFVSVFFLISLPLSFFFTNKYLSQLSTYRGYAPESRIRIYAKAIIGIENKPLYGWGWSNFDRAFKEIDYPMHYDVDLYVDKPHSHILETFVNGGIPLGIIYLFLLALILKKLIQKGTKYNSYLLAFIVYVIHSQTNIISISEEIIFWTILGSILTE